MASTAAKHRTDLQLHNACIYNRICLIAIDQLIAMNDNLTGLRMLDRLEGVTSLNTVIQVLDNFLTVFNPANRDPFVGSAIILRITSYNVCYTKLLRVTTPSTALNAPTKHAPFAFQSAKAVPSSQRSPGKGTHPPHLTQQAELPHLLGPQG